METVLNTTVDKIKTLDNELKFNEPIF